MADYSQLLAALQESQQNILARDPWLQSGKNVLTTQLNMPTDDPTQAIIANLAKNLVGGGLAGYGQARARNRSQALGDVFQLGQAMNLPVSQVEGLEKVGLLQDLMARQRQREWDEFTAKEVYRDELGQEAERRARAWELIKDPTLALRYQRLSGGAGQAQPMTRPQVQPQPLTTQEDRLSPQQIEELIPGRATPIRTQGRPAPMATPAPGQLSAPPEARGPDEYLQAWRQKRNDAIASGLSPEESNDLWPNPFEIEAQTRKTIRGMDTYKDFREVDGLYKGMLQTVRDRTPSSDLLFISSLARIFDPGSVVRTEEFKIVDERASEMLEQFKGEIERVVFQRGKLTPKTRQQMLNVARQKVNAFRGAYAQEAGQEARAAGERGGRPGSALPAALPTPYPEVDVNFQQFQSDPGRPPRGFVKLKGPDGFAFIDKETARAQGLIK